MAALNNQVEEIKSAQSAAQPTPEKTYYTIFPKNGTDISKTGDFIKELVGAKDLLPWSDVNDQLTHWTVEASLDQVSQLRGNTDIDHVTEFNPPAPPAATRSIHDMPAVERLAKRQDALADQYLVFATDGKNQAQTNQTVQYLQDLVGKQNVRPPFIYKDEIRYWLCNMTTAQSQAAAKNPGVKAVEVNKKGGYGRHLPPRDLPPLPSPVAKFSNLKAKRAVVYSTQKDAVTELVEVSQPSTIPDLTKLKNYVYESNNGKNSFVYHIESGVAFKKQSNEFPNVVPDDQHLQTDNAKDNGINPWDDPVQDSHGTCTAGKAVGNSYGVAKQAKLVVVQIWDINADEIINALRLIIQDIRARPERRKKSVVSMSLLLEPGNSDPNTEDILYELIKDLLDMDIPMFVCAGNFGTDPQRTDVDTYPALFAAADYPLVVVGSTDHGGARSSFSQGGLQVTLHAPGNQITCMLKNGNNPATDMFGTSYSTPIVAGEVANLLSYDTVPFDTSDGNLAKNLRDYLQTDAASWAQTPNIRVIWNGVTEKDNPSVVPPASIQQTPTPTPTPQLTCNGLASKKHVERNGLADHIQKEFCPDAVKQGGPDKDSGSITRRYNQGTLDEVSIIMDVPPGTPMPSEGDCEAHLLAITDDCDGNDPENPANYKSGGQFTVGINTYHIDPQAIRQPASNGVKGGCDSSYKGLFNEYTLWGAGWDSADYGAGLQTQVKGCALLPNTWSFSYGLGSDGREWTAKFRTGVFQKRCTGDAGKTASGIGDFGCSGSG